MSAGDWKEMYQAATTGDLELVRYHIKNGVDPNYQHPEILSAPLVTAIIHGHSRVAEFLLQHGANPDLVSVFDGINAFEAARKFNMIHLFPEGIPHPEPGLRGLLKRVFKRIKIT